MDVNSIALDDTANDSRRGTKKMTKVHAGCNLAGQIKEELKLVFFRLQYVLRACECVLERCHVNPSCSSKSIVYPNIHCAHKPSPKHICSMNGSEDFNAIPITSS